MSSAQFVWRVALVWISIVHFGVTMADPPRQVNENEENTEFLHLNDNEEIDCGICPEGKKRERSHGRYCGRCVPVSQSCANGYYMVNGKCQACPCPGTSGDRQFGTSCKVDVDGQVTCDCPSEYTGRDCSQCAPGTVQNNQPPYNCVRLNSTNSFAIRCPLGNRCSQPQIPQLQIPGVQVPPPPHHHHHHLPCPSSPHNHHDHHHHHHYPHAAQNPHFICPPCKCPDPENSGARRLGTSCNVDADGQVICKDPRPTPLDCSQCPSQSKPKVLQENEERQVHTTSSSSSPKPIYFHIFKTITELTHFIHFTSIFSGR